MLILLVATQLAKYIPIIGSINYLGIITEGTSAPSPNHAAERSAN
jgi:hypothetical protein